MGTAFLQGLFVVTRYNNGYEILKELKTPFATLSSVHNTLTMFRRNR